MNKLNIMIVGVGGQGTLLASKILGNVAVKKSYDVKVSEVHGMAQRGGSVVTYVKFGEKVYSPIIEKGEADILLAFEELEGLRWLDYLKPTGKIILNRQIINPMPVIIGKAKYPENITGKIKEAVKNTVVVEALPIAKECGNSKAVNVVLLGVLAKSTEVEKEVWVDAIREIVPQKLLDINMKAFEAGYGTVS
ncbi:MAG: indolepyruvate oxidoreductase subunit beta [Clostridiaceae bacterium]|nr:indolepyruvate oxidoreductase subunit beta [Clostridiaceae bacterium]